MNSSVGNSASGSAEAEWTAPLSACMIAFEVTVRDKPPVWITQRLSWTELWKRPPTFSLTAIDQMAIH
jgi:hypothetical protein